MSGAISAIAASSTFASIATVAKGIAAVSGAFGAVKSLTASRPSNSSYSPQSMPTITQPSQQPETKLSEVTQARREGMDRQRVAAAATAKQNETNLTSGLKLRNEEDTGTSRAKRTALGV